MLSSYTIQNRGKKEEAIICDIVNKEGVEKVITGEIEKIILHEKKLLVNQMQTLISGYWRVYFCKYIEEYIIPDDVSNLVAQFTSAARIDASFFKKRIDLIEIQSKELFTLFHDMQTQQVNIKCECDILLDRI